MKTLQIRVLCNQYIENNTKLKKIFSSLCEEDGITLQSFIEEFAKSVLEQNQKTSQDETIISLIDEAINKNESLTDMDIALISKYYTTQILNLNEIKSKISNLRQQ